MGIATVKRFYLKHQIFVKAKYFFQNITWSPPFFKVVCRFIWREEYSDGSFIFLTVLASFEGSAWAIHFFMEGVFFNGAVTGMHSFRGYMEQITFDSSHLLRTFARPILGILFFIDRILISPLLLHPSIPWSGVFVFVTVKIAFIHSLKGAIFILTGELAVILCLSNSFSSRYYIIIS